MNRNAYMRKLNRKRRRRARRLKLCGTCATRKPTGKHRTCDTCLAVAAKSKAAARLRRSFLECCAAFHVHRADCRGAA